MIDPDSEVIIRALCVRQGELEKACQLALDWFGLNYKGVQSVDVARKCRQVLGIPEPLSDPLTLSAQIMPK